MSTKSISHVLVVLQALLVTFLWSLIHPYQTRSCGFTTNNICRVAVHVGFPMLYTLSLKKELSGRTSITHSATMEGINSARCSVLHLHSGSTVFRIINVAGSECEPHA